MGTSGNATSVTQTDLVNKESLSQQSTSNSVAEQVTIFNYTLPSTSGTSGTYREFKLHNGSYDYDRIIFTGITWVHNGSQEISIAKKYFIRGSV